jgi:hypothetical protein
VYIKGFIYCRHNRLIPLSSFYDGFHFLPPAHKVDDATRASERDMLFTLGGSIF